MVEKAGGSGPGTEREREWIETEVVHDLDVVEAECIVV